MEGQGQCLKGQGEGHRVSRSLSDMCHHDLDVPNTCCAFKSPSNKRLIRLLIRRTFDVEINYNSYMISVK